MTESTSAYLLSIADEIMKKLGPEVQVVICEAPDIKTYFFRQEIETSLSIIADSAPDPKESVEDMFGEYISSLSEDIELFEESDLDVQKIELSLIEVTEWAIEEWGHKQKDESKKLKLNKIRDPPQWISCGMENMQ